MNRIFKILIAGLLILSGSTAIFAKSTEDEPFSTIKITKKGKSSETIRGGEFYNFDFNSFRDKFAIVEVISGTGDRISLYSIGYKKKAYSEVLYISPNAKKINIAFSQYENSFSTIREMISVEIPSKGDEPVLIAPDEVFAGAYNDFDFSAFNKTYAIVQCFDDDGREINWIAAKNLHNGKPIEVFIPSKTKKIKFSTSNSENSFYTSYDSVFVTPAENPITIKSFLSGSFRSLDLNIYQKVMTEPYGVIQYLDSDYNVVYTDDVENDGNGIFNNKVYVPKDAVHANVAFSKNQQSFLHAFDYLDIRSSNNASPLKAPFSLFEAKKFNNNQMNPTISEFINYLDMEKFRKSQNYDLLLDYIIQKVNQLTSDDYERIKLYHDAALCLLSYSKSAPVRDYKDAIMRERVSSDGFALLFKELCRKSNIPCLVISGNAKKFTHGEKGWNPKDGIFVNQYWNIVVINNYSYLIDVSLDSKEIPGTDFYSDAWLFVSPKDFIYSHYPLLPEFQLLDNPVSADEYLQLKYTKSGIVLDQEQAQNKDNVTAAENPENVLQNENAEETVSEEMKNESETEGAAEEETDSKKKKKKSKKSKTENEETAE